MNLLKRIITAMLCSAVITAPFAVMQTNAATFAQINADAVFVDQQTSYTCTLASNVMLLRRAAMMMGDANWAFITEKNCRPTLWNEYGGMICDYTYNGSIKSITVVNRRVDEMGGKSNPKQFFINMLKQHPEGVVIYDYDRPHAILLTDYTDGQFYCSDPWYEYPTKRIPVSQASISVESAESLWYIVSPELHLTTGSTNTSSTVSSSTVSNLNETWQVTDEAGLNLRADAGTAYNIIGFVPCKATVTVTKRRVNGGYTWGYVTYNSKNGWIALDYATKINTSANQAQQPKTETKTEVKVEQPVAETASHIFDNTSSISANELVLGDTLTINGSAEKGTAPYTYGYYYKRTYSDIWTTIKDFSSDTSVKVTPLTSTSYDVCVKVKDAKGNIEKKYMKFTVNKPLTNKSTTANSTAYLGDNITINGKASGGIGTYSYAYYYKRHSDSGWVTIKNFSSNTTASFTPLKDTDYDICVKVKDSTGKIERIDKTVRVYPKLVNSSKILVDHARVNDKVRITAAASGGAGSYEYAIYYKRAENSDWVTLKDFNVRTTAILQPLKATTYDICVKVKDSNGRVEKKYFKLYVSK